MVTTNPSNAFSKKKEKRHYDFLQIFPATGGVSHLQFVDYEFNFGLDWEYDTGESHMGYNSHSTFGWIKLGTRKFFHLFGSCISQFHPCFTILCDTAPLLKYIDTFWKVSFYGYYHFTRSYGCWLTLHLCQSHCVGCSRVGEGAIKMIQSQSFQLATFRSHLVHGCVL